MTRRIGVLVNPTSGRGKGARSAPEVLSRLAAGGVEVIEIQGVDADDAVRQATEAASTGLDALVACGGDGTVNLALRSIMGTAVPLGIVPVGTGDDIARSLGIPRGDVGAAVDVIVAGHLRTVDLGMAHCDGQGEHPFLGVLSAGFDSMVNERANRMSFPRGQAKYMAAIVAELGVFKPVAYHLELDGVPEDVDGMLVAVGNGTSYGGGMRVCPGAVIDDGSLSVLVLGKVSKPTFLRVFPRVFKGTHIEHPAVTERQARTVRISGAGQVAYADGERIGPLPATVAVRPGALHVLAP